MTSGARAWLVNERWFKAYPLVDDTTTIGRGSKNTIIIRDPAVSRNHAEVRREAGGFVLSASGESGTKINGEGVEGSRVLREGDVLEIAFTSLRFTEIAPTGEMFVVPRDTPTIIDKQDQPTRATLHAMHPITLISRSRRYWHFWLVGALVLLVVAICAGESL